MLKSSRSEFSRSSLDARTETVNEVRLKNIEDTLEKEAVDEEMKSFVERQ